MSSKQGHTESALDQPFTSPRLDPGGWLQCPAKCNTEEEGLTRIWLDTAGRCVHTGNAPDAIIYH